MTSKEGAAIIEAILFTMGDSVEISALAKSMEASAKEVKESIEYLKTKYENEDSGIGIIELENAVQLCTKKEMYEYLVKIAKTPRKAVLTDSLMETLSIVAYKQPITRLEVEKIRGVNSDHAVNRLVEFGLIQELGRLDAPGRPLLFGTTEEQEKYTVQSGDLISDIAYKNKLSVQEFLIANPEFTSENNLLYEGQVVNLGLINPLFKLIEEDHVVELQTETFETKIEYDENMVAGYEKVKQNGENGTIKVTKKVQKLNGEIQSAVITQTETIKPTINKIIVKGSKIIPTVGDVGVWAWPTIKPYQSTSGFGWRGYKMHQGIDIAGTGCNSPIYAANNGVVDKSGWNSTNGNYIYINHNNGYYTVYAHLATRDVSVGQTVSMGQKIGTMGRTGLASGCHLHFSISKGYPFVGGVFMNPFNFY